MTNTGLRSITDAFVNTAVEKLGLKHGTAVSGGQREIAQSYIAMSLLKHAKQILADAGVEINGQEDLIYVEKKKKAKKAKPGQPAGAGDQDDTDEDD